MSPNYIYLPHICYELVKALQLCDAVQVCSINGLTKSHDFHGGGSQLKLMYALLNLSYTRLNLRQLFSGQFYDTSS